MLDEWPMSRVNESLWYCVEARMMFVYLANGTDSDGLIPNDGRGMFVPAFQGERVVTVYVEKQSGSPYRSHTISSQ